MALVVTACGGALGPAGVATSNSASPGSTTPSAPPALPSSIIAPAWSNDGSSASPPSVAPTPGSTISPLASEVAAGVRDLPSAQYDPAQAVGTDPDVFAPSALTIARLDVTDVPIVPVGVSDSGELDVPDPRTVGWYRYGAAPGSPGSLVLAAHVDFNRVPGVFRRLTTLRAGDEVSVTGADGRVWRYVVTERTMYDKDALPPDRVWSRDGEPTLVLLTCGGQFNNQRRSFEQNIVVYARPVPLG